MRLLIVTQAVDTDDQALGFFHRWIQEFAKHTEQTQVICLKEGKHALPTHVHVLSLGKSAQGRPAWGWERATSRIRYLWKFYRYLRMLHREYDAVFVHMNQEYVLLGGIWWRATGKRIILWRNHKMGSLFTRIAGWLAHVVCYTSPAAYVAKYKNAVRMPIGIDTAAFVPLNSVRPRSVLFLGRLDPVKKTEVFVEALAQLHEEGISFTADVHGEATKAGTEYEHTLRNKMAPLVLEDVLTLNPAVPNHETPAIYAAHAIYVNLTPSGSFDKTIGEAMAAGCLVISANEAVKDVLGAGMFVAKSTSEDVARALRAALALPEEERARISAEQREYVEREHSLSLLSERLFGILAA